LVRIPAPEKSNPIIQQVSSLRFCLRDWAISLYNHRCRCMVSQLPRACTLFAVTVSFLCLGLPVAIPMHQFLQASMAIWHVAHGQGTWVARGPIAAKQQGCRSPKLSFQNDMGRRLNACAACSNSNFFWDEIQKYPSARDDVELYS